MAQTVELTTLHRALDQLRGCVEDLRGRYGDIPAVKRLAGDVDRMVLDASELDTVPPPTPIEKGPVLLLTDEPIDPAMWADADDEGLGGHYRGLGT